MTKPIYAVLLALNVILLLANGYFLFHNHLGVGVIVNGVAVLLTGWSSFLCVKGLWE